MQTKEFITKLDEASIVRAIEAAELRTSGEIRVFVSHQAESDALEAARKQFQRLGMAQTREHSGVLLFVAPMSQNFAVVGDSGVHEKCGDGFWVETAAGMGVCFKEQRFTDGITAAIERLGTLLAQHFPRQPDDQNELPNTVVRG